MRRVAIIGPGGAGKTTLARELGHRLGIEPTHLDELFWRPGWIEPPREEFAALQEELVRRERWIMDGNYGGTMDIRLRAADTVVFLDPHPLVCIWRITRRQAIGWAAGRPHLGPDLPDRLDREFLAFVRYVWNYRRTRRPGVLAKLAAHPGAVYHLKRKREVRRFLERLPSAR